MKLKNVLFAAVLIMAICASCAACGADRGGIICGAGSGFAAGTD